MTDTGAIAAGLVLGTATQASALTTIATWNFTSSPGGTQLSSFGISGSSVRIDFDVQGSSNDYSSVTVNFFRDVAGPLPDEKKGECGGVVRDPTLYCTFGGLSNRDRFHVTFLVGGPGKSSRVSAANP